MSTYNTIRNRTIQEYNTISIKLAQFLKSEISLDEFANYKSGVSKERIPLNSDWVYHRAASILLMAVERPRSVNFYRKHYASLKNRGVRTDKLFLASGFIIRHIIQKLEAKKFMVNIPLKGRYTNTNIKNKILSIINETK